MNFGFGVLLCYCVFVGVLPMFVFVCVAFSPNTFYKHILLCRFFVGSFSLSSSPRRRRLCFSSPFSFSKNQV